ncbi:GNAT family N-acetyltransferase [Acuticoccus sediminis]|uniref:GNAT family N-acetyltransferase n=1 Tax=Acuticoccus sediminis TaxID=2184697 RepID=A0A8B2NV36_9HYPH|nr:N-acetyltransferase [Acuticoccus sediminis]RAI04038.1 GNAT family N-acetyltransferase [Acuticoccus sediminis]
MHGRPPPPDLVIRPETENDDDAVEAIYRVAFGPGRYSRTAYRLREGIAHDPRVSFVADRSGLVIGAIRQTAVMVGGRPAYLLGPLAVAETAAKQGIGRTLLTRSIEAAAATMADALVLVGDPAFYAPSGFEQVWDEIVMPGPVERHRLMQRPMRGRVHGRLLADPWPEVAPEPLAPREAPAAT